MISTGAAEDELEDNVELENEKKTLYEIFNEIDIGGDQEVTWDQLQKFLESENSDRVDRLCEVCNLNPKELPQLFELLVEPSEDPAKRGQLYVDLDDLVHKIATEKNTCTERSIFRVEMELKRLVKQTKDDFKQVHAKFSESNERLNAEIGLIKQSLTSLLSSLDHKHGSMRSD